MASGRVSAGARAAASALRPVLAAPFGTGLVRPVTRTMPAWEDAMHRLDPDPDLHPLDAPLDTRPEPHPLDALLDLARAAAVAAVGGRPAPVADPRLHPEMAAPADAFVTLTAADHLRGCMGTLGADMPVGEAVVRAAGMAATRDPRFRPVDADELDRLRIEVSVLGPPRSLGDPEDFVPGRHGIVVEARGRRALLLPQVATEMGWGTTEMLDAVCEKAGLRADAWHDHGTRLSVFEVERVSGRVVVNATSQTS
jgi:AmmeMemoRadiSam system protein A